jgi:heavy metal sensor kinase
VRIRVRLAVLFALATLVLVAAGGFLFVHSLERGLETSLDTSLRTRSDGLTQKVADAQGAIDFQDSGRTNLIQPKDAIAQVLDPAGRVVESSEEAGPRPLVGRPVQQAARSGPRFTSVTRDHERSRVLVTTVHRGDGNWTVIVASSLESADSAVERVRNAFLFGGVIVVLLGAVGAWLLARGALRPVERMRRKAADISEHDAASRLPVPGTRDEISALATTMNELLARLQGALATQRAFVADAGHELRSPLAVLRTELELADRPNRSQSELLDAVRHAAGETDRLARLAEELLFLARSDDGRTAAQLELEPLMPLLIHAVEAYRGRASKQRVSLTVSGDDGIAAPLDVDHIRRAVDNLLDNALRFAPAGSEVRVEARQEASEVVIDVVDEGPGFPEEFLPRAFERFRRADDARTRADGGSGLGLAIVSAVVREHGGAAVAANRHEGGAAVSLRLPADRAPGQV